MLLAKTRLASAFVAAVIAGALGASASCSAPRTEPSPQPSISPNTPPSCTGRVGEDALRGFFRDLSSHQPVGEVLTRYVVPPKDFVRWWDGTLEAGETRTFYNGLEQHLEALQRGGFDLTVTEFRDVGFQGRGTPDAGGWFTFALTGRMKKGEPRHNQRTLSNKGGADCATGKLKAIVI